MSVLIFVEIYYKTTKMIEIPMKTRTNGNSRMYDTLSRITVQYSQFWNSPKVQNLQAQFFFDLEGNEGKHTRHHKTNKIIFTVFSLINPSIIGTQILLVRSCMSMKILSSNDKFESLGLQSVQKGWRFFVLGENCWPYNYINWFEGWMDIQWCKGELSQIRSKGWR